MMYVFMGADSSELNKKSAESRVVLTEKEGNDYYLSSFTFYASSFIIFSSFVNSFFVLAAGDGTNKV